MLSNLFKVAIRYILKHKSYSLLNIIGLAIGIACCILILLFVSHELSYDKFHEKADRIHRVAVRALIGDTKINQTYSSAITFQKLLEDFPEIINGVKMFKADRMPITLNDKTFFETGLMAADSTFFSVFSFSLHQGNPQKALAEPNTMVLTKNAAIKYFGHTNVIGQVLNINFSAYRMGNIDFKITGISENVPSNSHFHYDMLISLLSFPELINNTGWTANNFVSYVVLEESTSRIELEEKLKDFTRKYMGEESFDEWVAKGNFWEYFLQPVTSIHLNSDLNGEFEANGNRTYVYIFSVISVFILLIACINFMNLSTAKSSLRAKEVGLRKVVGSNRRTLIIQFIGESIIVSFIALIIALFFVHLLLPVYRNFVGRELSISYIDDLVVIPSLIGLGLVIGIISGSYPAFFLSSFKPISILRGGSVNKKGRNWLRNGLVIFQFAISIFLIICTLTVYQQLQYFQNKQLGFNKEQVLVINNPGSLVDQVDTFKDILRNYSNITDVSGSNMLPGTGFSNIGFGAEEVEESFTLNIGVCDYEYLNTLKLEMVKGRFFSRDFLSDSNAVVLNENAALLLGWEDPLGKKINNWGTNRGDFIVIGVVRDFHYEPLHQKIRPMALFLEGGYYKRVQENIAVRLNTQDISETISYIEDIWKNYVPEMPFEYSFLDEDYENLYTNEIQTRKIFTIFSLLAIFIACLGLFGLVSFMVENKTKEIAIRKVFGSSIPKIINRLNLSFVKWLLVASILSWPFAWITMNRWLENFAYRINLTWWVFLIAAVIALFIAIFVVSFQTVRAALHSPVEALRYE